jgi:glycosyltransferase involved in cell wall biosynthesis
MKSVSVIMPVYNGAAFLAEAIESVYAQNHANLELIVVDDASTDNSASIASQLGATVIQHTHNQGAAAARNRGLEVAQGDLVAFLDADDLWVADKLQKQFLALEQNPELVGVGCYVKPFHQNISHPEMVLETFVPQLGTSLFAREVFARVGHFDPSLRMAEDLDWLLRLRDLHEPFALLPEPLLHYRIHQSNTSSDKRKLDTWTLRVLFMRQKRHADKPPRLAEVRIL